MSRSLFLLLVLVDFEAAPAVVDAGAPVAQTKDFLSPQRKFPNWLEGAKVPKRSARGTRGRSFGGSDESGAPGGHLHVLQTAPPAQPGNRSSERRSGLFNPLYPLTDGSYWAYAVALLALLLFTAGLVGNLALMCTVWHNLYLKSTWNGVLAGLALWDFLVLFFCLPVVVFHELSVRRLLGDLSCRLVPYLEVTSLGIATFSLCALSIDRFNAAAAARPAAEPCQAIVSKLSIIWVGSMLLAAPELLLWRLLRESVSLPALPAYLQQKQLGGTLVAALRSRPETIQVDVCVREPSAELSDGVYALVLTYHQARVWWFLGCYVCLPLLFSLACDLLSRQLPPQGRSCPPGAEPRLRSSLTALAALHLCCNAPESLCSIILGYLPAHLRAELLPSALGLLGQFLLFLRCALTPFFMLFLRRSLGQALLDCCCCCLPNGGSSPSSSATATSAAASQPPSGKALRSVSAEGAAPGRGHWHGCSGAPGTPC